MNVAHCIHGLGLGGAQKIIGTIVRSRSPALRYFVYTPEDGILRGDVAEDGTTIHVVGRILPKLDPVWVARLSRRMTQDRIDLVHTHLFGDSLHGYLAARLAGRLPVVMTLHARAEELKMLHRLGYRWLLSRCDRVVACSEAVRQSYRRINRAAADGIITIPNGIETTVAPDDERACRSELERRFGIAPSCRVVAAAGRLVKAKGYDSLISAFARVNDERARLILFGEGPQRRQLEEQVRNEQLGDRVVLAGFQPDVSRLICGVDIVAFSSIHEGLPIALLEAMSAGRCLVITDIPGMMEAVTDGHEGIVVPVGDVAALADGLERALSDPELRRRLGRSARARCQDQFTADRMVGSYEALYRQLES